MRDRPFRRAFSLLLVLVIGGLGMPVLHGWSHAPDAPHAHTDAALGGAAFEAPHGHTACALCDATATAPALPEPERPRTGVLSPAAIPLPAEGPPAALPAPDGRAPPVTA